MLFSIFSDTHGDIFAIKEFIRQSKIYNVDEYIFLGDGINDVLFCKNLFDKQLNYVLGNCDFATAENTLTLHKNNLNIFITHGHIYNVKSGLENLVSKCLDNEINICCFGHTHQPVICNINNIYLINPGSLRHTNTFALLEIDKNKNYFASIINLGENYGIFR